MTASARFWAILLVISCMVLLAPAGMADTFTPVSAFTGAWQESWETFPKTPSIPSWPYYAYLPNGTVIFSGHGTVAGGNPTGLDIFKAGVCCWGLGTSGLAQPAEGLQALGQNAGMTVTITFADPISSFGGYFGAATGYGNPDPAVISASFYGPSQVLLGASAFSYTHSSDHSGILDWHGWVFDVPVSSVSLSGNFVTMDYLQANPYAAVPEPASLILFGSGLFLAALRRKLRR